MNIKLTVDDGAVTMQWTDMEPHKNDVAGYSVHATLGDAKDEAMRQCIPERDKWADAVRTARGFTLDEVWRP